MSTAASLPIAAGALFEPQGFQSRGERLSLRRSLVRAAELGRKLAVTGRGLVRRFLCVAENAPADPGAPEAGGVAEAMALLAHLPAWIAALRDRLDDEARLVGDFAYLMLALRRRRRAAASGNPPHPSVGEAAAEEAAADGTARDPEAALARAAARRRRRAERARAAMLVRRQADRMPLVAVVHEICLRLDRAARLLHRADLRDEIIGMARWSAWLCARDPDLSPPRGAAWRAVPAAPVREAEGGNDDDDDDLMDRDPPDPMERGPP